VRDEGEEGLHPAHRSQAILVGPARGPRAADVEQGFRTRSRRALAGMRGRERFQAARLLLSRRVRRSPAAQHTVLAYLQLRAVRGKDGRELPFSIKEIRTMVRSKRWTPQRLANLALVLKQAKAIAKRDKISPKQAFDKALRPSACKGRRRTSSAPG
jgi:hypothetical protein